MSKAGKSYSDLLRHPQWQKMRLKVLERDAFQCQACFATERTLHVHHEVYRKGAAPWEYELGDLITCCAACHGARHGKHEEGLSALSQAAQECLSGSEASLLANLLYWLSDALTDPDKKPSPEEAKNALKQLLKVLDNARGKDVGGFLLAAVQLTALLSIGRNFFREVDAKRRCAE